MAVTPDVARSATSTDESLGFARSVRAGFPPSALDDPILGHSATTGSGLNAGPPAW